jgi:hypothetical protein
MANRFVRRIKSGEIESIEELKSEFKALAKLSHPDLLGPGAGGDDFARLRAEYESALRDFVKHRFGARRDDPDAGGARGDPLSDDAWACLALLLKRGFPKIPRHEKEALRYEYARWRLARALGTERRGLFFACEPELLDMKTARSGALGLATGLLRNLIDYREKGLSAMRTDIVLSLGKLRGDPRIGPEFRAFALSLAGELGIGGELGAESATGSRFP